MKIGMHIFLAIPQSIKPKKSITHCSVSRMFCRIWPVKTGMEKKSNIVDFYAINKHCNIKFLSKLLKFAPNLSKKRRKNIGIEKSLVELIILGYDLLF